MSRTPLDILNLFVESPGDLLFFLLVIAFSQGALFLAFGHRSRFPFEHATRRFVITAAGLVVVWLVMLGAAFLAQYANLDANRFMPPLERLAYSATLIMITWAFLSADFVKWQNRSNLFVFGVTFLLTLLYVNTARDWLAVDGDAIGFNSTNFAPLWSGVLLAIAVAGGLLTITNVSHVVDAPLKLLFFLLFMLGNGLDLYQLAQGEIAGSYLGGARLSYVAGLVLFPLIIYRLAVALLENSLVEVVMAASQPSSAFTLTAAEADAPASAALMSAPSSWNFAAAPVQTDTRLLLNAIGIMMDSRDDADLSDQIVKATLESLGADVCILIRIQDNNYADVTAGYDRVADNKLSGISLNLSEQPTLSEAAKHGEQTILFPEYHADELSDLFRRLGIASLSCAYVQPLTIVSKTIAVLLVCLPYRQADLSVEEIESLRDIGFVAAHMLAWSSVATSSIRQADEQLIEDIAGKATETSIDPDALIANRRELETSLERVIERSGRLALQIADLKLQLQHQHIRLVESLVNDDSDPAAAQRLNATIDEQSNLRDACESSARELLDAETVLRVINVAGGETLAQVIREYLHKEYNLLVSIRDRLRRQINAALVMGKSAATDGFAVILQSLADETAQLELERDQQQRRLESITSKLESMGIGVGLTNTTQLLIQLYAERKTLSQHLAQLNQERTMLLSERRKSIAAGGSDSEELERQLKHLSADHEQLLNNREEMRREQQQLLARIAASEAEKVSLREQAKELDAALRAKVEGQEAFNRRISELAEERDNLLTLRDQLTAKVSAGLAESGDPPASSDAQSQLEELRATVNRLAEQREELALELSDARAELESAREIVPNLQPDITETTERYAPRRDDLLVSMLGELQTPMTSVSDYTELLLAESIGILGAAQQQVLKMIAADIDQLVKMINDLQEAANLDAARFSLQHSDVDIVSVVEDLIQERSLQLSENELMVELSLDDHLPSVYVDRASLKHILTQMAANACSVSPPGSRITISATVTSLRMPAALEPIDAIEISVRDQGGGIAPADMHRVFARKYRKENPAIVGFSETGVSMSIARAYARACDGDLWVTSDAAGGSVFHLALPLQLAASVEG